MKTTVPDAACRIFLELQRRGHEVFYYSGKGECDFILRKKSRVTGAIQACYRLDSDKARKREVNGILALGAGTGGEAATWEGGETAYLEKVWVEVMS